jgi:hypothetical protein
MVDLLSAYPQIGSIQVVRFPYCEHERREQFRFPKSKKRRIRDRWRKDPANWRTKKVCMMLRIGNTIHACDKIIEEMKKNVRKEAVNGL